MQRFPKVQVMGKNAGTPFPLRLYFSADDV
jgi:hypothetical protein